MSEPITIPKLLSTVDKFVMTRVEEIDEYHAERKIEEVTVECLDDLVVDVLELKNIVGLLADLSKNVNKAIMRLEGRAGSYLEGLGRDKYDSPDGGVEKKKEWHVCMPESDAAKLQLFEWLKSKDLFERYATVNSRSLNSLFMAEWEAAKKRDPEAAILFTLPGVPDPQINEYTTIKAPKGQRAKRKVDQDESDQQ